MAVAVEALRPHSHKETDVSQPSPFLIFWGGASTTYPMDHNLVTELERDDVFGAGNVMFERSLISWSTPELKRYREIASHIAAKLNEGTEVYLAMLSFGGMEGTIVGKHLLRSLPDLEGLHLVYDSSVGFPPFTGVKEVSKRLLKLAKSLPIPGAPASARRGLDSLLTIGDEEILGADWLTKLTDVLDERLVQKDENINSVPWSVPQATTFELSQETQDSMRKIDERLMQALERGDVQETIHELTRRGEATGNALRHLYLGKRKEGSSWRVTREAGIGLSNLFTIYSLGYLSAISLAVGMITGEPYKAAKEFRERGASVTFLHPIFDSLYKVEEIKTLAGELGGEVKQLPADHASVMANPASLAESLKEMLLVKAS